MSVLKKQDEPSTPPALNASGSPRREPHPAARLVSRVKKQAHVIKDIASVYGVQGANYVFPLVIVPYLARVLGPSMWGLVAMAQAFGTYGHLIVEYGFIYSATRDLARSSDKSEIERIVAGVTGARVLLSIVVMGLAWISYFAVPLFRDHPTLLWAAVISEILKAALPNYYFYGIQRVALASALDVSARTFAIAGVFFLVRGPQDAWKFFALQGVGAAVALIAAHWLIYSRYSLRMPRMEDGLRMLREGGSMFLFRSSHQIYALGNAFILGLFASAQAVGFYAGAEKVNSAAIGLLSPLSTALYPRSAGLAKTALGKAARLTVLSTYAMVGASVCLSLIMWFGAPLIVHIILGRHYDASEGVLKILSLRAPLVAWTNVMGFQWLLALGLEKPFQRVTMAAIAVNVLLATCFATTFSYTGMAWSVVLSQALPAVGIYLILRRRGLNPFAIQPGATRA